MNAKIHPAAEGAEMLILSVVVTALLMLAAWLWWAEIKHERFIRRLNMAVAPKPTPGPTPSPTPTPTPTPTPGG